MQRSLNRWHRRILFAVSCGFAALVPATAALAQTPRYEWKCYTYIPAATAPEYKSLLEMTEELKRETGGALQLNCNVGGSIPIKTATMTQAVSDDVIQFGMADSGAYSGFVQLAGMTSLPGLFATDEELGRGFTAVAPLLDAALAKKNVKYLGAVHYPRQVFWGVGPLASLADISGKKIRVTTPEQAEFARRFNAVPVTIGSPEVSSALQSGLVQVVLTASAGGGRLWKEHFKSNFRAGPNYVTVLLIANRKTFDKLPADLQAKVSARVQKWGDELTAKLSRDEETLTQEFAKSGMVVTRGKPEDFRAIEDKMRSYWLEWAKAKGPEAEEGLNRLLAELKKKAS